jgi:CDP-glucose 4,6-dehydratase
MKVLITGHTGFKGSWLSLLLTALGHTVSGISLPPRHGVLYKEGGLSNIFEQEFFLDIRNKEEIYKVLQACAPDVIVHMAAQPLVIESYAHPRLTFETNVLGTLNVIEAANQVESVKVVLSVTTDKVYRDQGSIAYDEDSPLGGYDPYSASKAMADILSQSLGNVSADLTVVTARAGNVIGAWDGSPNRLLPDTIRALNTKSPLKIRNPKSVRPWQHVLDCVGAYWSFIEATMDKSTGEKVLNFGPSPTHFLTVKEVIDMTQAKFPELQVEFEASPHKETPFLTLDSSRARTSLAWKEAFSPKEAVELTLAEMGCGDARKEAERQVRLFQERSGRLA